MGPLLLSVMLLQWLMLLLRREGGYFPLALMHGANVPKSGVFSLQQLQCCSAVVATLVLAMLLRCLLHAWLSLLSLQVVRNGRVDKAAWTSPCGLGTCQCLPLRWLIQLPLLLFSVEPEKTYP